MKYSKQFSVDPKFISKLIGPNGVNIKAISFSKDVHKNRPNSKCFIEFKNNICYIYTIELHCRAPGHPGHIGLLKIKNIIFFAS